MRRFTARVAAILFALLLTPAITGCGQKGPLKLPPESPKTSAPSSAR